jgi:hypothetical protein
MYFILLYFLFLIQPNQDWITYFQNKKIEVSYKAIICDDKKNGFNFEYYSIRVKNKTDETLVINFQKGSEAEINEEETVAFVLNPSEVISGNCEYSPFDLKVFKSENTSKGNNTNNPFALTKINVVEVY